MKHALGILVVVALTVAAVAQETEEGRRPRPWQFYWENDAGAILSGSDEFYTNGLRLSIGQRENRAATTVRENFCERFCGEIARPQGDLSYVFGHNIYTPNDISVATPQPLDRPWAGWIYGAASLVITDSPQIQSRVQHILEAQIGILGQGAGAQFVQSEFHKIIGDEPPRGWANQLENEPGLNLIWVHNRRYGGSRADVVVSPAVMLGTIQTYPALGGTARLGYNITGFPIAPIIGTAVSGGERPPFEIYVFGGGEARYMLHNAFLDGGFFRDGPSVERRELVHDLRAGLSARLHSFRFTYTFVRRSEELTPTPGRANGRHDFGSVSLSWEPNLD